MEPQQNEKPVFGRDIPWKDVKEKICRVINFTALAKVEDGKVIALNRATPYAFLTVECEGLPGEATIWVTHRIDFLHLWLAFVRCNEAKGEQVLVIPLLRNVFLPMLRVWLCPKGAFNKMVHPELQKPREAGFREIAPIAEWGED